MAYKLIDNHRMVKCAECKVEDEVLAFRHTKKGFLCKDCYNQYKKELDDERRLRTGA